MNERSIVYDDDPPNISKLKREINGIMNDLMGPEGALKSPPYSNADSMESPSLSNIAEMPIEFQQDEEDYKYLIDNDLNNLEQSFLNLIKLCFLKYKYQNYHH